jgi:hypothetical protein
MSSLMSRNHAGRGPSGAGRRWSVPTGRNTALEKEIEYALLRTPMVREAEEVS